MQHCPKTVRFAKDIWTMKCCRCNEVMLQARGDLEKLLRNAGDDKSGLRVLWRKSEVQAGLVKPFCFSFSAVTGLWCLSFSWGDELTGALWWEVKPELKELMQVPRPLHLLSVLLLWAIGRRLAFSLQSSISFFYLFYFILCFIFYVFFFPAISQSLKYTEWT